MVSSIIVPVFPQASLLLYLFLRAFCLLSFLSFLSFFVFFVFLCVCVCVCVCVFFPCGFFFYDDDGDMDTRTLFDDFLMKEILAGRSDDFFGTTKFLTIFLFEDLSGRRTSRYRRRPGFSSPSMPLLIFWPHAARRLGRRGGSSAMRSVFVARVAARRAPYDRQKKNVAPAPVAGQVLAAAAGRPPEHGNGPGKPRPVGS